MSLLTYFHSSLYLYEAIEMQYHNSIAKKLKFTDMENIFPGKTTQYLETQWSCVWFC